MCAVLVLAHIDEVDLFAGLVVLAFLGIGGTWHMRLAKVTCLRAAGYTYDWKTHTAHKIRPSDEGAAAPSSTASQSSST